MNSLLMKDERICACRGQRPWERTAWWQKKMLWKGEKAALKTRLPSCAVVRCAASSVSDWLPAAQAPVSSRQPRSGRTSTRRRPPGFMPTSASGNKLQFLFWSKCELNLARSWLYRHRSLQANTRFSASVAICKIIELNSASIHPRKTLEGLGHLPSSPAFLLFEKFEWNAEVDNVLSR